MPFATQELPTRRCIPNYYLQIVTAGDDEEAVRGEVAAANGVIVTMQFEHDDSSLNVPDFRRAVTRARHDSVACTGMQPFSGMPTMTIDNHRLSSVNPHRWGKTCNT